MAENGHWQCICLAGNSESKAWIASQTSLDNLRGVLGKVFAASLKNKEFTITDYNIDLLADKDLEHLAAGDTIWIIDQSLDPHTTKERVAFPPHPKTLTMAGDYEYFAAQGRAPFPYALAELIDNSLRATYRGRDTDRKIIVSFVLNSTTNPSSGLVSVWDNGCGMTKKELNDWAVMNLSMEDRGSQPAELAVQRGDKQGAGASRFLTGNLSYFGVGSKNAAFYLGKRIRVTTSHIRSKYVHELSIAASDLEQRYRDGKAVYEEDLIHRQPGMTSALDPGEKDFPVTRQWVREEATCSQQGNPDASDVMSGFTRIVIGDLKPEILRDLGNAAGREQLCRSLAHLYHYYLHGEQGNVDGGAQRRGQDAPQVSLECIAGRNTIWTCDLADVNDDLESLYLQAQKSTLRFSLDVPGKGQVEGVLYYFPFHDASESLPIEDFNLVHNPISNFATTQQQQGNHNTQSHVTQAQQLTQALRDSGSEEENEIPLLLRAKAPLFEAFWQGRLIPAARIESLQFIEAVRSKRSAAAKDFIPDDSFMRLRGALFFGPSFLVTRNKLTFRDNLQELLAAAVPRERSQEKIFKDWLAQCHRTLDKVTRFEKIGTKELQEEAEKQVGRQSCVFERILDGSRVVERNDLVQLAVKPHLVGRVCFFSVAQDVQEEGVYANGFVTVQPMPIEIHGPNTRKTLPLRRIEKVLEDADMEDYVTRELQKVPTSIIVEPAEVSEHLTAGVDLPESMATIFNGSKQKVTRGHIGGERHQYAVTQQVWFSAGEPGVELAQEQAPPARKAKKKGRKGRQADAEAANVPHNAPVPGAELVAEVENTKPSKDGYCFSRLAGCLDRAGKYTVVYTLAPARPTLGPLSTSLPIHVEAGPAVKMTVQGEGRSAMATADLMLGEWLPDIDLVFKDQYGNASMKGISPESQVMLEVLTTKSNSKGDKEEVVMADLMCYFTQALSEGGKRIVISSLQIFGPPDLNAEQGPLSIFAVQEADASPEGCAQAEAEAQGTLHREVKVKFGWVGLGSELVALRLLPGLPRVLRLMPGHPFLEAGIHDDQLLTQVPAHSHRPAAKVPSSAEVPSFTVRAVDQWGNCTQPCPEMPFSLVVSSAALEAETATFPFAPSAIVTGLKTGPVKQDVGKAVPFLCRLMFPGASEEAVKEVLGGGELPSLNLAIQLQPSTAPCSLQLLWNDQPVPLQAHESGSNTVALLEGAEAGSTIMGLAFQCLDEAGRLAEIGTPGKVQVSWSRGTKKVKLQDQPLALPDIQVQDQAEECPMACWLRFSAAGKVALDLAVHVKVVAGPPHSWSAEALDRGSASQGLDANGKVKCGQFFSLEITAMDAFNNRCHGRVSELTPAPVIIPESPDADNSLVFETSEWVQNWVSQENGNETFTAKIRLGGNPGPVHLHVCDRDGPEDSSRLEADRLDIVLEAGPPSCIMFDAPSILNCGTHSALGELRVKATDNYGNKAGGSFEVALLPSAVSSDGTGRAASVTAANGNKARVRHGVGMFKDVYIGADQAGQYILKAKPSSREVTGEASVMVKMVPVNAVTAITLAARSTDQAIKLTAPCSLVVDVELETEDHRPVPHDAASEGLTVSLEFSNNKQSKIIRLQGSTERQNADGMTVAFMSEELTTAGEATITAEYQETRPELASAQKSKQQLMRAVALAVTIFPGPVHALTLDSQPMADRLAVTNAANKHQRTLLKAASLQLRDRFGNAVEALDVSVTVSLAWPEGQSPGRKQRELPQLELAERMTQVSDSQGRVFFGDVYIREGSGQVEPGSTEPTMEMELLFRAESSRGEPCGQCKCLVLFSDDAQRFLVLQQLNENQQVLASKRQSLVHQLEQAKDSTASASGEYRSACRAVERRQKEVTGRLDDVATAQAALAQMQQKQQQSLVGGMVLEAKFGGPDQSMTKALTRCLQGGKSGVLGVFAQLGTVDQEALSRVLAANYRSMLVVLIVEDADCRSSLEQLMSKSRLVMPDVLCMSHVLKYEKSTRGEVPGWRGADDLAKELQGAACDGTDPAIPLALPHTRAINSSRKGLQGLVLGPDEWPGGCLGYAFNLVRPVLKGSRCSLLYPVLGQALVFESLDHAQAYREYCTQVLKQPLADIITLDFKRISGKGIISGASFRVPTLQETHICFGTTPSDQVPAATQARHELAGLEQLVDLLQERAQAQAQLHQAEQVEAEVSADVQTELDQVEAQIRALEAQMGSQPAQSPGEGSAGKKRRSHKGASKGDRENQPPSNCVEDEILPHKGQAEPKKRRLTRLRGS